MDGRRLLASALHEVRTPIQTIISTIELLGDTPLNTEQSEYVRQIEFSANVLLNLANDVLDISKITSPEFKIETMPFDIISLTEHVTDLVSIEAFNKGNSLYGRRSFCRECEKKIQSTPDRKKRRRELELLRRQDPEYVRKANERDKRRVHNNPQSTKLALLRSAKQRAKSRRLDFNIDASDIDLPNKCPLLGIPLFSSYRGESKTYDNSYSIDRIDPRKGYIKGNVWVISYKANRIKNDATLDELETLVKNLKNYWEH